MSQLDDSEHWLKRLVREVIDFRFDHFRLGDDLRQLDAVWRVGATEAVILYCARILEVLTVAALHEIRLEPTTNACSNLVMLEQYNLLPKRTRSWAHSLRRLGNAARHVKSVHGSDDANLALCLVQRWLEWFFQEFAYGRRLESLTSKGARFELGDDPQLARLLATIDRFADDPAFGVTELEAQLGPALLGTTVAPALVAEVLIDRAAVDAARTVLEAALARHSKDLRLRQLMGLAWSRSGDFGDARRWLEPLVNQYPDDDETAGICAGVYKGMWQHDRTGRDWLRKSNRMYRRGWDRSRKANPYLGINAATTALWLGKADESKGLAGRVQKLLSKRVGGVARGGKHLELSLSYWDQVTLAEAFLIQAEFEQAANAYRQAFLRYVDQRGNIVKTRQQIRAVLEYLRTPFDDQGLLAKATG